MTLNTRFALLALVLCAVLVAGARHASAAPTSKAETRSTAVGARAVEVAHHWLGVRYSYGGTSPRSGFDCSGFVRFVYDRLGFELPHSSYAQFDLGKRVARKALRPGDLVFFDGVGHVGIYVGANRFIHAANSGTRVSVDSMSGWYGARYDGGRRLA
jgi:cell wall-associated NlpC family hydrolase